MKLNEVQIKAKALNRLRRLNRINQRTAIASELPLYGSGVRADLAYCTTKRIVGIEIKSDFDSLRRLRRQMDVYVRHFDHSILILGQNNLRKIETSEFPEIEIWSVLGDKIEIIQRIKLAHRHNSSLETIANFRKKFEPTSQNFWLTVKGRSVSTDDLAALSRYHELRRLGTELESKYEEIVSQWDRLRSGF